MTDLIQAMLSSPSEAVVTLTEQLISLDTAGGGECAAAELLAELFTRAGASCEQRPVGEGRANLLVSEGRPRVSFTGHLDTVPADASRWDSPPWAARIDGDRLYGRGASDMKGAIAAMSVAAIRHVSRPHVCQGVELLLTAGEEEGCLGASALVESGFEPTGRVLVVGEPTGNVPTLGHNGALWAESRARGRSAHGSSPELGENAVMTLAAYADRVVQAVGALCPEDARRPTINIGALHGGTVANIVPDDATMLVDVRTVPRFDNAGARALLNAKAPPGVTLGVLLDLPVVSSDPQAPEVASLLRTCRTVTGNPDTVPFARYFTDASVLAPRSSPRTALLLGPGDPDQAHTTNESCRVSKLVEAVTLYEALLRCEGEED